MISKWQEITDFSKKMSGSVEGAPLPLRVKHAHRMVSGLFMEVAELQDSFSWKVARDVSRTEEAWVDRDNVIREMIDCLFFLVHIGNSFGISPVELEAMYASVMANNIKRHVDGDFSAETENESPTVLEELTTIRVMLNELLTEQEELNDGN